MDAVSAPDVPGHPAELGQVLDRPAAVQLLTVRVLLDGLGQVSVQPQPEPAGQLRRLDHQLPRHRERRAGRDRELHQSVVVLEPGQPRRLGEHLVDRLHQRVRRKPAVRLAEIHRAPRGDDPYPQLARGLHLGLPQPLTASRKDVMVVEHRCTSGQRQLGEARTGGCVLALRVDPGPHRVQLAQPLEQGRLLRPGSRQRLVEVVVGVDEARRDDRSGEVDDDLRRGRDTAAHGLDQPVTHEHPAVRKLVARIVHRADPAVLQEHRHRAPRPYRGAPFTASPRLV